MVEGDGLENRCTRMGTVGSNPTLSAIFFALPFGVCRVLFVVRSVVYVRYTPSLSSLAKPGNHPNGFAKAQIPRRRNNGTAA